MQGSMWMFTQLPSFQYSKEASHTTHTLLRLRHVPFYSSSLQGSITLCIVHSCVGSNGVGLEW